MATSSAASKGLALAASPTFALMALTAAHDGTMVLCSTASSLLPMSGMTTMYLLMSLFHLSPWLRLACRAPGAPIQPTITKGD